jgi:hypothetical protein
MYDGLIAGVHLLAGLNGVVLLNAAVISGTFALLFHFVLSRSQNLFVAALLALVAMAAAQVHMLARPHVFSWLLTLLWVESLCRFEEGKYSALFWLPPLMLSWANLHAGFILGPVLVAIFAAGHIARLPGARSENDRQEINRLAAVFSVCLLASFLTPYGYQLHAHVFQYLSNSYLMNNIEEFASPNFHLPVYRYFELFFVLAIAGVLFARERITVTGLLLLLFALHAGLFAVRNIPIAAIIMSLVLGPLLTGAVVPRSNGHSRYQWLDIPLHAGQSISNGMVQLNRQLRGHTLVLVVVMATIAVALNDGRLLSKPVLAAHFDEKIFPVKATQFLRQQQIRDHLFSSDAWSGYLIYRLYPMTRVYFDDRHDFYGESYVREYGEAVLGTRQWQEPLDHYQVQWVLMPTDSALSSLLRESQDWRIAYEDGVAIVFFRVGKRNK